jgi:hypothetical protein
MTGESKMENIVTPQYLRVDEITEAYNAIMMFKEFLKHAQQDVYYKWAILAIHNALQGFFVLALKGTSNLSIIVRKDIYNGKTPYEILCDPEPKLKSFLELFMMIKCSKNMNNKELTDKSGMITRNISDLNLIRNDFIHYLPKGWSIGIQGIVCILVAALIVISFLFSECIEIRRHYSEQQLSDIKEAIDICNMILSQIKNPE